MAGWEDEYRPNAGASSDADASTRIGGVGSFARSAIAPTEPSWEDQYKPSPEKDAPIPENTSGVKAKEALKNTFVGQLARKYLPGHAAMEDVVSPSLTKGVPITRQFVPQTPDLSQFEQEHPYASTGLNLAGEIGSTLPMLAGASARMGPGLLKQFAGQAAVNAPLNMADLVAQKGDKVTEKEATNNALISLLSSVPVPGMTSALGQSARHSLPPTQSELDTLIKQVTRERMLARATGRTPETFEEMTQRILGRGNPGGAIPASNIPGGGHAITDLMSALAGYHLGGWQGLTEGALTGHIVVHPVLQAIGESRAGQEANRFARQPATQDVLRALESHRGREMAPYTNIY